MMPKPIQRHVMRCTCRSPYFILAMAFVAGGFWSLVHGFVLQLNGVRVTLTFLWYFLAFMLMGTGKYLKWDACAKCAVHGWKK
ncbi:MAG: hypothetical protein HY366_01340 [Candidatus Aenigmarchaeota archaeon]|nr:hypothetical protein [Candidatus Aenigmarchaeota archaeon]